MNSLCFFTFASGALLSYLLQPVYLSSIVIAQSPNSCGDCSMLSQMESAINGRSLQFLPTQLSAFSVNKVCLSGVLPFQKMLKQLNMTKFSLEFRWQPLFFVAPIPSKEFQHSETAQTTLTCGWVPFYSISSGLLFLSYLHNCYFHFQVFSMLEHVWVAWSHTWYHRKKTRHIRQRGTLSIYHVIYMQVSDTDSASS